MKPHPQWTLLAIGALIVAILFAFPLWRKVLTPRGGKAPFVVSDAQQAVFANWKKGYVPGAQATAVAAMQTIVPAPTAEQPTPVLPEASVIRSAEFTSLDAVRQSAGTITLYRSADGSLLLRFDDFSVTNAPGLSVYLVAMPNPQITDDLDSPNAPHFDVGALKGTLGNQQYNIPKQLPIQNYKSVVIYSEGLQLIYASAQLQ